KIKGTNAGVTPIKDELIEQVLPKTTFFAVRYRQYPIAMKTPEGLKASNVCAVGPDGKVQILTDTDGLLKFFQANLTAAKTDDQVKDATRAWLRLSQELKQDGYYKFKLMDDSTKVETAKGAKTGTGKVVVMDGGNGEISVTLNFDEGGKLAKAA